MVNIKLNMTYKVGDPVSVEWEKLQKFLFRKEILEVSCQQGNFQPIQETSLSSLSRLPSS